MNNITLGLVSFLTILAWLLVAYIVWAQIKQRRSYSKPNPILGYVTDITQDKNGLTLSGVLNDHGRELAKRGALGGLVSARFDNSGFVEKDGVRIIPEAKLHGISIDSETGPYGGKIHIVGHQPTKD